jgi:serine/threonine protein kinase/tetratricopeptide (TPR) repeat protein
MFGANETVKSADNTTDERKPLQHENTAPPCDRYLLEGPVGEGSCGVVYRARDRVLNSQVALKLLHLENTEDCDLVIREVSIAQGLTHPNIIRINDVVDVQGRLGVSMELVEGQTLAALLEQHRVLSPKRVIKLGLDVAHALAYAHARHIIHNDLKPSNILLHNDSAKLTDFGLAVCRNTPFRGEYTGTPQYMSPERQQQLPVDHRTDLYSLGLILFEASIGRRPKPDELSSDQSDPLKDALHDVPRVVRKVISKCLRKRPVDRYSSADELIRDLSRWPLDRARSLHLHRLIPSVRRRGILVGAFTFCAAAVVATTFIHKSTVTPHSARILLFPILAKGSRQAEGKLLSEMISARINTTPGIDGYLVPDSSVGPLPNDLVKNVDISIKITLTSQGAQIEVDSTKVREQSRTSFVKGESLSNLETVIWEKISGAAGLTSEGDLAFPPLPKSERLQTAIIEANSVLSKAPDVQTLVSVIATLDQVVKTDATCSVCILLRARAESLLAQECEDKVVRDKALSDARRAFSKDRSWYTIFQVSKICLLAGKYDEVSQLIEHRPMLHTAAAHYLLGLVLDNQQVYDYAVDQFREALARNPFDLAVLNALGIAYIQRASYPQAISTFQQMLRIDSGDVAALNNLATAYLRSGRIREAIPPLETVVAANRGAASYANLGFAWAELGKSAVALPYFAEACALKPNALYTGMLAHAYRWSGMSAEATRQYRKAINLAETELRFRTSADQLADLGLYYAALRDSDSFEANFAKAAAAVTTMNPVDLQLKQAIGYVLLGDGVRARQLLEDVSKSGYNMALAEQNPDLASLHLTESSRSTN